MKTPARHLNRSYDVHIRRPPHPTRYSGFSLATVRSHGQRRLNVRKQDRIANQQQSDSQEPRTHGEQPDPTKREQVKGSASETQRPPRPSGKLPLPD